MKKLLLSICILVLVNSSYGQDQAVPDSSNLSFNVDLGVASRNIWRGLDYGSSPSIWGDLYGSFKKFSIGAMGTSTLNGSKSGYGNWMELYASYTFKNLTFVADRNFYHILLHHLSFHWRKKSCPLLDMETLNMNVMNHGQ